MNEKLMLAEELAQILHNIEDCDDCPLTNICDGNICNELSIVIENETEDY